MQAEISRPMAYNLILQMNKAFNHLKTLQYVQSLNHFQLL